MDRLFNRIDQEPEVPEGSSTPVSLPNVIQQIVSNPALPQVEGHKWKENLEIDSIRVIHQQDRHRVYHQQQPLHCCTIP